MIVALLNRWASLQHVAPGLARLCGWEPTPSRLEHKLALAAMGAVEYTGDLADGYCGGYAVCGVPRG